MELIKRCASFVNDSMPETCTGLLSVGRWDPGSLARLSAWGLGSGSDGQARWQWMLRVTGQWDSYLWASSLQAGCEGAWSKAGADLPCLASRLSCVKSVTLSFPQISAGY